MGKANSPGSKINRIKNTLGTGIGLKSGGGTDAYKTISKGKKFATKNGGKSNGSASKYC